VSAVAFVLGQGCPSPGGAFGPVASERTALKRQAVVAVCLAPGGLGQATGVTRNATGDHLDGGLLQIVSSDSRDSAGRDLALVTCPAVTAGSSLGEGTAVQLAIDFGSKPCRALPEISEPDLTCPGQAMDRTFPTAERWSWRMI